MDLVFHPEADKIQSGGNFASIWQGSIPTQLVLAGALYAFGSLLAFTFSHASILSLRLRQPDTERPFKLGWNIRIWGRELPISAIIGVLATATIWTIILITQPYSRWAGIIWMVIGLVIFYLYRRKRQAATTGTGQDEERQSSKTV